MTIPYNIGWRIATALVDLPVGSAFFVRKIPPPTTAIYADHGEKVAHSEGGESRHGYRNIRIFWDVIDRNQASALRAVLDDAVTNFGSIVFLTLDRSNGEAGGEDWIDVSGRLHMPDFNPFANVRNRGYQGVELFVNNITIINDPATNL